MSPTNVLEEGFESLIVASLTGLGDSAAGDGYVPGESSDFDRDYAVDLVFWPFYMPPSRKHLSNWA
jgi:hypothetical protein